MRKNFGVKTWIYPQPVLIIGTYDENDRPNAMNAAWGGICDYDKLMIDLSEHKTTANMDIHKAFTVHVGDRAHAAACDYVGIVSGNDVPDKFERAGFTQVCGEFVHAPIINELPIALECELLEKLSDGKYIGKIVNVSADERYLGADGLPDLSAFTPITFDPVHNKYIALGECVADAFSAGRALE